MRHLHKSCLFVFLLFTTSCGYHFVNKGRSTALCVPFVEGDRDGFFTKALIYEVSKSSNLNYETCAPYCLEVCLKAPRDENIGFRFAPKDEQSDGFTNILTPEEARLTLTAVVSISNEQTGCVEFGPIEITSSVTYDFESDFSNLDFHSFSLGQLEMHPLAKDNAFCPLYSLLAQKIVDTVQLSW